MEDKNLTIWQRLSQSFGPNSLLGQDLPTYKFDKKELLRTQSKDEYEKQKLQAQQTYYLVSQWAKVENNLYNQAVYYEPTRLASYYDFESMEYSLSSETLIATPDGFITIKDLADKGRDYEFIVYAYDHNTEKVVPALARNAHYTRDEMTYKITFDDGSHIIATYGHRFLKRDGVFEVVENLKPGDSMMPFYRKSFFDNQNYNWVYVCNSNEGHHGWVSEHKLIAEWYYDKKVSVDEEIHHKDFNGKNNNPENLQIMNISEHRAYHRKLNNEKLWANPEFREKMSIVAKKKGKLSWNGRRVGVKNPSYFHIPYDLIVQKATEHKTLMGTASALNISYKKLQREITYAGYKDWSTFCFAYGIGKSKYSIAKVKGDSYVFNHKIVSIEPHGVVPVYDLSVPGYKNFATDTIFSHNTPEIASALDTYAEESTTVDENGFMLQIYSDSPRIKSILADLFNNALDINTNLPMWTRNTAKYGDNFVFLKLDPEKGVVGCLQLPNIEIERIEVGMKGRATSGFGAAQASNADTKSLTFTWKNKQLDFNSWEIAHFRLLGDDRKLPYGTAMTEKARRIWKQLVLAEDAMLVYRTSRAPERRVFKVYVGNMDDADVYPYVQRFAQQFKKDQIADPKTGNVDMRFNQMAVDQDFFIPVRDPAAPTPIDTLAGAQNLSEIADIEYIQKKLLTALRIPKAFLGFEEPVGDGKNLSLQDIRFARTINRIQKCMISELNKIAIIHLFLLGFEDELGSFQLSLTNPSKQADLLAVEVWKEKMLLYRDCVTKIEGIAPVSQAWAKKHVLGFSDDEIKLDLQQQRMEMAVATELTNTPNVINRTGIFDSIDKLYGKQVMSGESSTTGTLPMGGVEPLPPSGGGFGGDIGVGGTPPPPLGVPTLAPESRKKTPNIILERMEIENREEIDFDKGEKILSSIQNELDKLSDETI